MSHPDPDEAVRRLLADARHDEPVPADVVARLDATLADLLSTRVPVVDLAARRRRRVAGAVLAAASVVVIGGIALPQMLPTSSTNDTASAGRAASESSATNEAAPFAESNEAEAPSGDSSGDLQSGGSDARKEQQESAGGAQLNEAAPSTTAGEFLAGAPALSSASSPADNLARIPVGQLYAAYSRDLSACTAAARPLDTVLPVTFDGQEALAVWLHRREPLRVVVRRCSDGVRLWAAPLP